MFDGVGEAESPPRDAMAKLRRTSKRSADIQGRVDTRRVFQHRAAWFEFWRLPLRYSSEQRAFFAFLFAVGPTSVTIYFQETFCSFGLGTFVLFGVSPYNS